MKDDIESAYPQFDFNAESVLLMGVRISPGKLFFYLTGMFGWTGCPMVFACIGRAMERYINARSDCPTDLFVDDFMALALAALADAHQSLIHRTINGTFPGAVSLSKCVDPQSSQSF